MTETENSCEPYSRPASSSWPASTKFTTAVLFVTVLFLLKLLLHYCESIVVCWGNILFLILYTAILCLIFLILNQNVLSQFSSSTESSYVGPLFRARSRLTFLPITHFISQTNTVDKSKGNDNISDEQSNTVTKTEISSRIEEQRDILIDEILQGYVFPWYNRISDEETFPSHFKNVLQKVCTRFNEKLRQIDRTTLAKEAIQLIHCHWKEYCDVVARGDTTEENITKNFKLSHVFVEQKSDLSRYYENLVCLILRELVIPDLQSNLLCQFLSGILVKCFVMYYVDMISQPKWINTTLVCLISSGGQEMTPSQNCPLPETPISTCSSSIFASEDSVIKVAESSISEDRPSNLYDKSLLNNGKSTPSPQPSVDFFNDELHLHSRNITPSDDSSLNEAQNIKFQDFLSSDENMGVYEFSVKIQAKQTEAENGNVGAEDMFGKNMENDKTDEDEITDGNKPEKNNFVHIKEEATITETKNGEKNSKETNQTNGKKITKEKVKLAKSNPLFGSVSSALSGLLTTAALPLLPEGCHGSLENLSAKGSPVKAKFSSAAATPNELTEKEEPKRRLSADGPHQPVQTGNNLICDEWKDQTTGGKVNSRHYSFDESARAKSNYNLETKSLDESKSQIILRQEEFDYGNKENEKMLTAEQSEKANISPMYEEPEDFAATIAKLRSLLEQRESRKNLLISDTDSEAAQDMPKTNSPEPSHQLPRNSSGILKGRPTLNSQSSASSLGSDGSGSSIMQLNTDIDKMEKIVDELEDPEPLQCLFTNVQVSRAESLNDSSDQHTLYSIQYEGVYPEEDDDGQLGKIVLRTTTVKRRFKEFLLLQSQLEENKIFKPHLKGIKAPIKWLNLSFSKVDSAVLNQRKTLLEKYLQQLCYHPILGFCQELRQFMAYGEEGFKASCLSDGGTNVPRFDKLAKKFTGVINTLRDALPTFESDSLSVPSSPDGGWKSPGDSKGSKLFSSFLQFGEKIPPEEIKTIITASTPESKATESLEQPWVNEGESGNNEEDLLSEEKQEQSLSEAHFEDENNLSDPLPEETNASIYPLAAAVTQLLCDVLWLPDHRPHTASVGAFMTISGKSLENYVQETLDMFLSEDAFLRYLELFTVTMKSWNDSSEIVDEQTGYYTESDLKNCLKKKIPVWVRWMWGRHRLDMTIERMAGFCQNSVLNHDLILSLIELIFSKIVDKKETRQDNLNCNES